MFRTIRLIACFTMSLAHQADPKAAQPMCGVVTSYRIDKPATGGCDLRLTVTPADAARPFTVRIEDAARRQMPGRPWDYFHQDVCVSGAMISDRAEPTILVTQPSQIDVTSTPSAPPFGAGAVSQCDVALQSPRLLKDVKPSYTGDAMRERAEGTVVMDAVVDIDGTVGEARVTRAVHQQLDEEALRALRQWRFVPGMRDGKPVRVLLEVEMTFKIARSRRD